MIRIMHALGEERVLLRPGHPLGGIPAGDGADARGDAALHHQRGGPGTRLRQHPAQRLRRRRPLRAVRSGQSVSPSCTEIGWLSSVPMTRY